MQPARSHRNLRGRDGDPRHSKRLRKDDHGLVDLCFGDDQRRDKSQRVLVRGVDDEAVFEAFLDDILRNGLVKHRAHHEARAAHLFDGVA